jgi:hypothetical protein
MPLPPHHQSAITTSVVKEAEKKAWELFHSSSTHRHWIKARVKYRSQMTLFGVQVQQVPAACHPAILWHRLSQERIPKNPGNREWMQSLGARGDYVTHSAVSVRTILEYGVWVSSAPGPLQVKRRCSLNWMADPGPAMVTPRSRWRLELDLLAWPTRLL